MWRPGDAIVRRDVWHGRPVVGWSGIVVADDDDLLVLYMPGGGPLSTTLDFFGAPHPWSSKDRWEGHGVLQLQRPGEMHAVWVFWQGPERELGAWYVNIQEPFRRTRLGFDTQDLELDIVISPHGAWRWKDDELLDVWVERGRWTAAEVAEIRAEGARVVAGLEAGRRWWSDEWAEWEPDPTWQVPPELPPGWDDAPYLWWGRPSTSGEASGSGQCRSGHLLPGWVLVRGRPALSRCTDGLRRRDDRSGVSRDWFAAARSMEAGQAGGRWRREQCGSWPQGHLGDGGRRAHGW